MASTNQDNKSNNIDIQKMVEFVKKNARYFVAGALFVVILLILVKFTGNEPEMQTTITWQLLRRL